MRSLNNFRAEQPHEHAMYYLQLLMTEVAWTKNELKEALDGKFLPNLNCMFSMLLGMLIWFTLKEICPKVPWIVVRSNNYYDCCEEVETNMEKFLFFHDCDSKCIEINL